MFAPSYGDLFFDTGTSTSGTASLPTATINVFDTTDFPSSGNIQIWTGAAYVTVAYTGKTGSSFTGCTGGTGTFAVGAAVGRAGLKWKHVRGAELVTVLANTVHLANVSMFGATGCAMWVTGNAGFESFPDGGGAAGGSNFWGLKDSTVAYCGSSVTSNSANTNHGHTSHVQEKFMGGGRSNVDAATYFNVPNIWGNATCAVKDRTLVMNLHIDH